MHRDILSQLFLTHRGEQGEVKIVNKEGMKDKMSEVCAVKNAVNNWRSTVLMQETRWLLAELVW